MIKEERFVVINIENGFVLVKDNLPTLQNPYVIIDKKTKRKTHRFLTYEASPKGLMITHSDGDKRVYTFNLLEKTPWFSKENPSYKFTPNTLRADDQEKELTESFN